MAGSDICDSRPHAGETRIKRFTARVDQSIWGAGSRVSFRIFISIQIRWELEVGLVALHNINTSLGNNFPFSYCLIFLSSFGLIHHCVLKGEKNELTGQVAHRVTRALLVMLRLRILPKLKVGICEQKYEAAALQKEVHSMDCGSIIMLSWMFPSLEGLY